MPEETPLQAFTITVQLSDALISYLKSKPYEEVQHLIQGLQGSYQTTADELRASLPNDNPKNAKKQKGEQPSE